MSIELMAVILIGGLLVLLALGVEIAVAMGAVACFGFIFFIGKPLIQIPWTAWGTLNSWVLMAAPLFIFMGTMFSNTGVVRSLFEGADKWIGGLPGSLACSVIGASALFGAISGSSVAAAATFSIISYPEMEKRGYAPRLGLGAICVGGTLSVLIPPSILLIIYGAWQEQSVARLFAAALVPGLMLAALLMCTVMVMVILNPSLAPKSPPVSWKERLASIGGLLPWLGIIALVLGVIFGGVMTPTEASALGAFLGIVVTLGYRRFTYKALKDSVYTAIRVSAMIGFILVGAKLLVFVFQDTGLTELFSSFMLGLPFGKYGTLATICVMYLIMGMFFDALSMMLLTLPFVMPVIIGFGFHPVWWGVTYVILAEIGMVTPPFGLNLFTVHSVLPKHSILTIARGTLPFLIPMLALVAILIAFPDLALWLPSILY